MLWSQSVVLQSQTLCVAVAIALSPTWCATTRPTVLMNQMRWTAVSRNGKLVSLELGVNPSYCGTGKQLSTQTFHSFLPSFSLVDHIVGSPGACNFNMDEKQWEESCQLSQDADDNFDWRIGHQSETPGAGPPADHSPGQYPLCTLKLYV